MAMQPAGYTLLKLIYTATQLSSRMLGELMKSNIAFVTGASRGIGKQTAIALAKKGFDVVITARTMEEGEAHEHGTDHSDIGALPGSLQTTAKTIEALGRRALPLRLDLLDPQSINSAVDQAIAEWNHIDLLVNNGIYQGPGVMKRVMELDQQMMQNIFQGNVFSQLLLVQRCLPTMLERNRGFIINVVSQSGMIDPSAPVGEGGWGFAYSASKAALLRMSGILIAEHKDTNVQFFNVEPGLIITESLKAQGLAEVFSQRYGGAPPTVPAAVIAWLASVPESEKYQGETIYAQRECLKRNLVPNWQPGNS